MSRPSRPPAHDPGAALVEVLLSIVLVGVAVVAIVGSQGNSLLATSADQNRATARLALNNAAEALRDPAVTPFVGCDPDGPNPSRPAPPVALRSGWAITADYRWWDGTGFGDVCPADAQLRDVQLVTLAVTDPIGHTVTLDVVKASWT